MCRYFGLLNEVVETRLVEDGARAHLEHRVPGSPDGCGRHPNEFPLGWLRRQSTAFVGRFEVESACFMYLRSGDLGPLTTALGTTAVAFGADCNRLTFPARYLNEAVRTADEALLSVLDRYAERDLSERDHDNRFVGDLRRRIRTELADGPIPLATLASVVGMSQRTLQRRLRDEGLTLSTLVDDVRRGAAERLFEDSGHSSTEIAYLLGYGDARAFLRAFKRWTGTTPAAMRRAPVA
ncbi:MAG: AraC-like DNA-binding protein [Myxococcota bacterium]|jgi:AraC-like DNA-binding protein